MFTVWILLLFENSLASYMCDVTLGKDRKSCGESCKKHTFQECEESFYSDDAYTVPAVSECLVFDSQEFLSDCDDQLSEIGLVLEFLLPFGNYNLTITNFNDTANDIQFVFDKHVLALSALTSKSFQFNKSAGPEFAIYSSKTFGLIDKKLLNFTIKIQSSFEACDEDCSFCCHETGFCYDHFERCDGNWECPNGEDEWECDKEEHTAIPLSHLCDGINDCYKSKDRPSADEMQCTVCRHGAFLCARTNTSIPYCIAEDQLCDGFNDCIDGSDERSCPLADERRVLTAAIIGSLGCCALFVIALGCTRRLLYVQSLTSCSRARRSLQHLANILQVREAPPTYDAAMGYESTAQRPSRSRPWRLTRNGLRRESRRARRRRIIQDQDNASIDLPSVSEEQPTIVSERTQSSESLEWRRTGSERIDSSAGVLQFPSPETVVPADISAHESVQLNRTGTGPGPTGGPDEDERRSISSQH